MQSNAWNLSSTKTVLLLGALLCTTFVAAQTQPVTATIDASKTGVPISKYIYGQFLEYGGNIVNEGVWSELEDRKFYYPIASKPHRCPVRFPFRRSA